VGDARCGCLEVSELVVATSGLSKRYRGAALAVDGADLRVERGEICAFLGQLLSRLA